MLSKGNSASAMRAHKISAGGGAPLSATGAAEAPRATHIENCNARPPPKVGISCETSAHFWLCGYTPKSFLDYGARFHRACARFGDLRENPLSWLADARFTRPGLQTSIWDFVAFSAILLPLYKRIPLEMSAGRGRATISRAPSCRLVPTTGRKR